MDAREAISMAKAYVSSVFHDEGVFNIGLEEIRIDPKSKRWEVTIGFSRRWDQPTFQNALAPQAAMRTYKVVEMGTDGTVLGLRNRTGDVEAQ